MAMQCGAKLRKRLCVLSGYRLAARAGCAMRTGAATTFADKACLNTRNGARGAYMDASLLQEQIFKCFLTKSIAAIHSVFVAADVWAADA
ncbi:hypothetical protein D3870_17165 [Noviherbaspirillum cavernae]|uniref:Uncharacterized protein n=1 Tax=Noviherbaspirillum cavernae TaxID=2320862 RepID=A0A418X4T1_9BURK|nr:hypothetical protein D3870_17165 [Noviherbaspirillum cavernae]